MLDQLEWKIHPLQINGHGRSRFQPHFIDTHVLTLLFGCHTQRHLAIGFEGHDEIPFEVVFDEHHIVCRGVPDIIDHITEGDLVGNHLAQQLLVHFIFCHSCPAFLLARFGIEIDFSLGHQMVVHGQRHLLNMVQGGNEVDAFDGLSAGVVVMPTNDLVFIRVRLFRDAVVNNDDSVACLYLTYIRLHNFPEVRPSFGWTCQKALDAIMTDCPVQQPRQSSTSGQSKRTDEIIGVYIEQFFIVHDRSLHHFDVLCA